MTEREGAAPRSARSDRRHDTAFGTALGALSGILLASLGVVSMVPGFNATSALIVLSIIAGLLAGWLGRIRFAAATTVAIVALSILVTLTPAVGFVTSRWVRDDGPSASPQDAIIVLSGGANDDRTLGPSAVDRLLEGLQLWKDGRARRIVTTRETVSLGGAAFTTDYGQRRLIRLAGAESAWTIVSEVASTHDEAVRSAEALLPDSARRVLVVTSALHTRRACATFEQVGFVVHCVVAPGASAGLRNPQATDQRLMALRSLLHEVAGMLRYRLSGWV